MSGGWVRCGPDWMTEVGGAWRCCRAPLSRQVAAVPAWEAFLEINRMLAGRLLDLLVERMVRAAGGSGGERSERHDQAARGAG